jgi:hypothetical protein
MIAFICGIIETYSLTIYLPMHALFKCSVSAFGFLRSVALLGMLV